MKLFVQHRLVVSVLILVTVLIPGLVARAEAQSAAPGGFVESDAATSARPNLSAAQIAAFMPTRGAFTFPAPYNTSGARITTASDCGGGDCVFPVGYSYWRNINNHAGSDTMLIFLALNRGKGGSGPTLFSYNKNSGETRNLGGLFDTNSPYATATGEGFYFSATQATKLYVFTGAQLSRFDVLSKQTQLVFNAAARFGSDKYIWQIHSSNDDKVHSFTLRQNGTWAMLGCGAYSENTQQYWYFPARGDYDECQIDKSGRYLMIKENVDGQAGEDNVIEDLQTGAERIYLDQQGSGGHSDSGFGYEVAEDNWHAKPGAVRIFRFDQDQSDTSNGNGTLVFHTTSWDISAGHISHANAAPGTPISQQFACSSTASRQNLPRGNEVLCFRLDGSLRSLVVAPIMTDLNAAGGGTEDYNKFPKGNLDPTGQYFIWTTNLGGGRMDAVIARVPSQLIGGTSAPASGVQMALDGPNGEAQQPFMVGGWAVDLGAANGSGVDTVHVWAWPTSGASPIFLGVAGYGWSRPDVAGVFGAHYAPSGYGMVVGGLPLGDYRIVASARSTLTGQFVSAKPLDIRIATRPIISIDSPSNGQHVGGAFQVGGWAIDLGEGFGTGIDTVHVYAQSKATGAVTFLTMASLGGGRPDVGNLYGARFGTAGFNAVASGLAPGGYDLLIYTRSGSSKAINLVSRFIIVD
jgi:hypothetical protein